MPPHTRTQRRRQNTSRPKERPAISDTEIAAVANSEATMASAAQPTAQRQARTQRRGVGRSALEPVDYSKEYDAIRRDLRRIAIWSILLFAAMIALRLSGLV